MRPERVPVPVRMFFYTVSFLGVVLGGMPWVFYRVDARFPAIHVEIGWFRLVGAILFVLGFSLYLAASYVLSSRGKGPFVEFDPPKLLVVEGPYRYLRNPIVACLLGTMLGEAIALSSTGVLLMFFCFMVMAHRQVTLLEEPLLRLRFGRAYEDYCAQVPRWIPRRGPWRAS